VLAGQFASNFMALLSRMTASWAGVGLGLGYIIPVATLIKWFPDKRGMITGNRPWRDSAPAPSLPAPIAAHLIKTVGIPETFGFLGICYFARWWEAAIFIEKPRGGL